MTTVERIITLLSENGVSASKMSKELGFSNGLFSQWKSGLQKPSSDKIEKIAEYFNVTTDYLLGKTDIPTPFVIDPSLNDGYPVPTAMLEQLRQQKAAPAPANTQREADILELLSYVELLNDRELIMLLGELKERTKGRSVADVEENAG